MTLSSILVAITAAAATAGLFAYPVLGRNKTIALIGVVLIVGAIGTKLVLGMR